MYNRVKGLVGLGELQGPSSPQLYMPKAEPYNTRPVGHKGPVPECLHPSYSQRLPALAATSPKALGNGTITGTNLGLEIIGQSSHRINVPISRPAILSQYQFAETPAASKILPYIGVNQRVIKKKPVVAIEKPALYPEVQQGLQPKVLRGLSAIQPDVEMYMSKPTADATRLPPIYINNKVSSAPTAAPRSVAVGDRDSERKADRPSNHLPRSTIPGMANKPRYVPRMLVASSTPSVPSRHMPPMMLGVTATGLVADQKRKYLPPMYDRRPYKLPSIDGNDKDPARYENTAELHQPLSMAKHVMSTKAKKEKKKKRSHRR